MRLFLKLVYLSLVLILFSCSDKLADDLKVYINVKISKTINMEKNFTSFYNKVNFNSEKPNSGLSRYYQNVLYEEIKNIIIPEYKNLLKESESIVPETKELREVHEIYIEAVNTEYNATLLLLEAINKKDSKIIIESNEKFNKSRTLKRKYQSELKDLCKNHKVEMISINEKDTKNTKNFDESFLITSKSVGKINFEMTYHDALGYFQGYNYDVFSQLCIFDDKSQMIIGFKNGISGLDEEKADDNRYNIEKIEVGSNEFKTKEGITPGMPINELLKVYPNIKLELITDNSGTPKEAFKPENYNSKEYSMKIIVNSNNYELLGTYEGNLYEEEGGYKPNLKIIAQNFRKDGKVSSIEISKL